MRLAGGAAMHLLRRRTFDERARLARLDRQILLWLSEGRPRTDGPPPRIQFARARSGSSMDRAVVHYESQGGLRGLQPRLDERSGKSGGADPESDASGEEGCPRYGLSSGCGSLANQDGDGLPAHHSASPDSRTPFPLPARQPQATTLIPGLDRGANRRGRGDSLRTPIRSPQTQSGRTRRSYP